MKEEKDMEIKEFGMNIAKEMQSNLGEKYCIEYNEVIKNNHVTYHALVIKKEKVNVAPTLYIDGFYEQYLKGTSVTRIVDQVISLYEKSLPPKSLDVTFFQDFAKVADKLSFKLVNYSKNQEKLKEIPYKKFEDLALIPVCIVNNEEIGDGVIVINYKHLNLWEVSFDELWENVMVSAPKVCPAKIETMLETIPDSSILYGGFEDMPGLYNNILVVSNESRMNGAGVILYQGMLKQLSDFFEGDFVVIPSSIHESIVMPSYNNAVGFEGLVNIVHEVNSSVVAEEEILSDNIYIYNRDKGVLKRFE
jgi:hypothetical protein